MSTPEPIVSGSERALLENMLDRNRAALVATVEGLSEDAARRRLVASSTTPIGLLKHGAAAERFWFQRFLGGLDEDECDGVATPGEVSFVVGPNETVADVIAEFYRAVERSKEIAAGHQLDDILPKPGGGDVSVRWIHLHMIEHAARHAGHGDILLEQLEHPTGS